MKTLTIQWQRLVDEQGKTCPRCGGTGRSIENAIKTLKEALAPLKIKVTAEKKRINRRAFKKDPLASNRIFLNGEPLEDIISARVGSSRCCDACGDDLCRTYKSGGKTHEAVPEKMIIKAALIAVAKLL